MTQDLLILCCAAFTAGFIDAIVGGGGLIQTPATLLTLPQYPLATLLGTTKIPSFTGTAVAAIQYAGKIKVHFKLLATMCGIAVLAAYSGSYTVAHVNNQLMKPVFFFVLIGVGIYTFTKKDFGIVSATSLTSKKEMLYGSLFALIVGFYDGFIGPGAGSFLIIFFISALKFDFLKASAHAKFVNLATNMGSIIFFSATGHILYHFAIPMAICNVTGAFFGARLAILKGNRFIRVFFLLVITATILRFGYDIFLKAH